MRRSWLVLVLLLSGCETLFPELYKPPADMASDGGGDGGIGTPHVSGAVCALADPRDYRSCSATRSGGFRVTVEETRESTMTDFQGAFVLPLMKTLEVATLAVVDPRNNFLTSIVVVRLKDGVSDGAALPILEAQALQLMAQQNGFVLDPSRGALFAWAVDAKGVPLASVAATPKTAALGPFYDGNTAGQISPGNATRGNGLVALFDLAAPTAKLGLTPGPAMPFKADVFDVPVRPNALTLTALILPPL
jgi:hypothetical protein